RIEQRDRLQAVARRARTVLLDDPAVVDRLLHRRDDEALVELLDTAIAELDDLGEVVARVDVHQREREARRAERLLGQAQQHDRVLAAREEQHGALELRGDLAHDVDRLGFEVAEVGQLVTGAHAVSGAAYGGRERNQRMPATSAPIASGAPMMIAGGIPTSAFDRSASPAANRTHASVARMTPTGRRTARPEPTQTPGIEPSRIVPASTKSTLPATMCASAAAHRRIAAWKTSVPTTRR